MTKAANISIGPITDGPNHHGHSLGAESVCAYQLGATYADEPDKRTDPDMFAFVRLSELGAKGGAEPDGHGQNLRFVLSVRSAHAPDTRGLGKERRSPRPRRRDDRQGT